MTSHNAVDGTDDVLRLVEETVYTVTREIDRVRVTLVPPDGVSGNPHDSRGGTNEGTVSFVLRTEQEDDTASIDIDYGSPVWSLAYDPRGVHRPDYPIRVPLWWCFPSETRQLYTFILLAVDALLLRKTFGVPVSVREGLVDSDEFVALIRGIANGVLWEVGDMPESVSIR